ncbi:hypothetical protein FB107DRAFT_222664, partial [Schizophyllum commune]
PGTQKGYLLAAHTAFSEARGQNKYNAARLRAMPTALLVSPIKLRRQRTKFITGAIIEVEGRDNADLNMLHGLPSRFIIAPDDFPIGSVMAFETQMQN